MTALVFGLIILIFGLPFLIRGWIFFLRPEHTISQQAKERNLRLGLETDMKVWGRKVRRLGFIICSIGIALIWFSQK